MKSRKDLNIIITKNFSKIYNKLKILQSLAEFFSTSPSYILIKINFEKIPIYFFKKIYMFLFKC